MEVVELSSTEQEIHVVVSPSYSNTASLRFAERRLLWENLEVVFKLHSLPWMIAGNFNEVVMGEDKFGGKPVNVSKAICFQECSNSCRMIDIGFSRAQFTWSNHRPLAHLIQERIDRVFVNADWYGLYPEASVNHLERSHSDHSPILMCLDSRHGIMLPQPSKFQPMWLSHPSFPKVVKEAWTKPNALSQAIVHFTKKARV